MARMGFLTKSNSPQSPVGESHCGGRYLREADIVEGIRGSLSASPNKIFQTRDNNPECEQTGHRLPC